ncbi:hypothetical protein ACFVTC_32945 [Streptomyces sp. NPDC057950]|uniref:hypothetical protein n=1 Tax=Streptomyces sp. NPDC057950 TaxID=3346288 RepID=UPI0036ED1A18
MNEEARGGGAELSGMVDRVRYRASWQQSLPLGLILGVVVLTQLSNPSLWEHHRSGLTGLPFESRVLAMVALVLVTLELWVLTHYVGVTLTPEAVVVHNLRRRTIPWADVAEVAVEPVTGGRRVVLYETDGRRTPLRMPSSGFLSRDRRFDDKVATIRSWWLAHGGAARAADRAGESGGWGDTYGRQPERLGMRPTPSRSVPTVLLLCWLAADAVMAGFAVGPDADHPTLLSRTLGALAAISLLLGAGFLSLGRGVTLTADHLVVRGLRPRTVAWDEIQGIAVERHRGGRRPVVLEAGGRRTPLPVPRVGRVLWDSEFETRIRTLRHWWSTHAETGTTPPEPALRHPDEPPLLPYRGPRPWQKAVLALACIVLGYEILLSVLVGALFLTVGQ